MLLSETYLDGNVMLTLQWEGKITTHATATN